LVLTRDNDFHVLPSYEPEIGLALQDLLRSEGIDLQTSTKVVRVEEVIGGIHVYTTQGMVEATHLLVATGRRPNSDYLSLEAAGVSTDGRGFIRVDEYLRTNVAHIWAAGDVIDGQMATPVGAHDGAIVAQNAFANANRRTDRTIIPRAIFTDPQVGVVGLTHKEALARGLSCRCAAIAMEHVPRAAAIHDTRGLVKMVIEDKSERMVGASILASHASEFIHTAALAIRARMTIDDLIDSLFVYPTFSEAIKIDALAFRKDVSQLSCCAE
jgi:mercuric reductase